MNTNTTVNLTKENFQSVVSGAKVPVIVDFWAEWCGPCRMLNPTLELIAEERGASAIVAKVNVDEQPELASQFGVRSIPTLLIFKEGENIDRVTGVVPKSDIDKLL